MSSLYRLPCSCGQTIPVDATQAGQEVVCPSCQQTMQAPSLLSIKKLEPYEEVVEAGVSRGGSSGNLRHAFFLIGAVLFLAGLFPLVFFVVKTYPSPEKVLDKRVKFAFGDKELSQDSTPIPGFEQMVLVISDEEIDSLPPIQLYYYFLWMKEEQNFGDNFYENYQALVDAYYIRVTAMAILTLVGIGVFVAGFFMPKRTTEVTGWSGGEW